MMRRWNSWVIVVVVAGLALLALLGCRDTKQDSDNPPAVVDHEVASYPLKGIVVSSDTVKGEVTVDTEAITGLMGAMTMSYKLASPGIASELHPGDHLNANLHIAKSGSTLDQIVVTGQAQPDYKPTATYNVPAPGQSVPNFTFLNQSGKAVSINQLRGKALLVTFIYTRCPLPDYCIRMSRNFADIEKQLAGQPDLYNRTHLLSISFDPEYDTPKVLRAYGSLYLGRKEEGFAHWDFAAPRAADLKAVDQFFDVGVSSGANRTLTHSLSTALITPEGKIFRWYPTNDWSPDAVVDDIQKALAQPKR